MTSGLLSVRAYARRRSISHTAVQLAIRSGRIVRGLKLEPGKKQPKIDPVVADAEWEANTHPGNSRAGAERSAQQDDYRKALTLERVAKTRRAEMLLDRDLGRLVPIEEVRDALSEIFRPARNQLLELCDSLAEELAAETNAAQISKILRREVKDVLTKLADRARRSSLAAIEEVNGAAREADGAR